jgi:hypothetical protein
LVAVQMLGLIYTSIDSGTTWTASTAPSTNWHAVASSADGNKLIAASFPAIYTSTNSGATWTASTAPSTDWRAVASSADGTKLVAVQMLGLIYTSIDSGTTWTATTAPSTFWQAVASSADGNNLVAAGSYGGLIYVSNDSGTTWRVTSAPNQNWWSVASSADGARVVAASAEWVNSAGGLVYISQATPTPQLNIAPAPNSLTLFWIIPSMNFALQQNFDLTTTNWTNVTNTPVLNLTNLQNQVTLPLPASNAFFRLKSP